MAKTSSNKSITLTQQKKKKKKGYHWTGTVTKSTLNPVRVTGQRATKMAMSASIPSLFLLFHQPYESE